MASSSSSPYRLLLAYDGSAFFGWQKTAAGPTIQGALEEALLAILQEPIAVEGCSRTDRGVHARGQVATFHTAKEIRSLEALQRGLQAKLPPSIRILALDFAPLSFHPTLDATQKEYRYYVSQSGLPHQRHCSWHYPYPLDLTLMRQAASFFVGRHDFAAFTNTKNNESYESTIRCLERFTLTEEDDLLTFTLVADNFLYKMARNLVGTVVYVGAGKIALEELPTILYNKDRRASGMTAPAQGLSLYHINYQEYATEKRSLLVS